MYATKSLSELKAIAAELNIVPTGDKRSKQSWITAIEAHHVSIQAEAESMPELPQEAISMAADMAMAVTTESESITTESNTAEVDVTDYGDIPQTIAETELEPATPIDYGAKRGAATVISALVVMVIAAIRAILIGGCTIARALVLIGSMFGKYNLDLWYQLQLRVKPPQPSYS